MIASFPYLQVIHPVVGRIFEPVVELEFRARARWIGKSSGKGVDLAIHAEQSGMDPKLQ